MARIKSNGTQVYAVIAWSAWSWWRLYSNWFGWWKCRSHAVNSISWYMHTCATVGAI